MEIYIVTIVSTFISLVSLIFTILALIICCTQQTWKKRDGVLLFTIFFVDILFSCVVATTNITRLQGRSSFNSTGHTVLANVFVFVLLLSWGSQCLIAINRYVVIIFPFAYKKILGRSSLCSLVAVMWISCFIGCVLSVTLGAITIEKTTKAVKLTYWFVFAHLSKNVVMIILALHLFFLGVIFLMECYLWKIARGHQSRYRSITHSVVNKGDLANNAAKPALENKRQSVTQTLQKRLSFSTQKMAVRRTPFLLLGAHFITIIHYCGIGMIFALGKLRVFETDAFNYLCVFLLIANSLRPIINVFHHISSNKMKRFKLLLQMLITKEPEHCTEYYIENRKEVENLFKLRRESTHSIVTEGSIV